MMESICAKIQWWMVEKSPVKSFEWQENHTFGASVKFLVTSIVAYLSTVVIFYYLLPRPRLPTPILRTVSSVHNLFLLSLSLIMVVGCALATFSQMPNFHWIFCFPQKETVSRGPVFFWAYVFYLSKLLEFSDTFLILLNPNKRLTFLHVYHHAIVVVMCYIWLSQSQSLIPVALVTNAAVHVLMYGYYFLCSLGIRPRWKRAVTDCQIVQFVFSFAISGVFLWLHFSGDGCSGMKGWIFNAVFNASLLGLFIDFHIRNYKRSGKSEIKK